MEYNTKRGDMQFREYGRSIEKMIESVCNAEDGEKKNEASRALVGVMSQVSGMSLKDEVSLHKLWDHLMLMSSFRLSSAWPYSQDELEKLKQRSSEGSSKPTERLPYKDSKIGKRHFGSNLEAMIKKLKEMENGEEYDALLELVSKQAKRSYLAWNGELSDDEIIVNAIAAISGDERVGERLHGKQININPGSIPVEQTPSKKKRKRKKKNNNNNAD